MAEQKERRATPRKASSTPAKPKLDRPVEDDVHKRIETSAYFKAKARGFQPGYEMQDWLEAEREVKRGERSPS